MSKIGATGKFPQGKINADDEGELTMAIGITKERVIHVSFGKPVKWIGMDPSSARKMAALLIKYADQLEQ